jgi:hypothetical protein
MNNRKNVHTVSEANLLWCPMARYSDEHIGPSCNRYDDGEGNTIENPLPCRCISIDCALWRWVVDGGDCCDFGYCSLGGSPMK